ncbi:unnamed protein product [Bursaphelenchus okinawaensis]|uniref:ShKT domain-containing protein n=1 Tax=Bursaphelenchus okinawaensis TaxID=465554 RepID=A0A811LLW7_9BILA|nr:unnamed protein product [Bursaphelenchus okinawaensis]CAG9126731.1 unnamed protein product [Bursaphelenchus okinawaensis]
MNGLYFLLLSLNFVLAVIHPECQDLDPGCRDWVSNSRDQCRVTGYIQSKCPRSCHICMKIPAKFDELNAPANLRPLGWLIGIWRSEHDGKAFFPTIPKFTYGEQIEFSIPDHQLTARSAFNYTAFAWSMDGSEELHSENGYLVVQNGRFALTTVMSNGFVTVEEGMLSGQSLRFRLVDIGRISFSRDLPVHDLVREWRLVNPNTLEARLSMETLTHGMREHTTIVYKKIFP